MPPTSAYAKGLDAEQVAKDYLQHKGYVLLWHRYKTKFGEIDLIVHQGNTLTFMEVKRRSNVATGLWCISPKAQKRLWNTGLHFLQHHPKEPSWDSIQFDAILVFPDTAITHITNILTATENQMALS